MSSFYTTCAKCGDEVGSVHSLIWIDGKPWHPECATEKDRQGERGKLVREFVVGYLQAFELPANPKDDDAMQARARKLLQLY